MVKISTGSKIFFQEQIGWFFLWKPLTYSEKNKSEISNHHTYARLVYHLLVSRHAVIHNEKNKENPNL